VTVAGPELSYLGRVFSDYALFKNYDHKDFAKNFGLVPANEL
jgi:hypothetical protein